jgi:hypothetical protein
MTAQPPSSEPDKVSAGTTWQWRRDDLVDYPSPDWTLRYLFANSGASFTFDATADGGGFLVTRTVAQTAAIAPGSYAWSANVTNDNGTTLFEVGRGTMVVQASLATAGDQRSHAQKVLDAIEAVIEKRATASDLQYQISVGGSMRQLQRIPHADLLKIRNDYRAEVRAEREKARLDQGQRSRRVIRTRFAPLARSPFPRSY